MKAKLKKKAPVARPAKARHSSISQLVVEAMTKDIDVPRKRLMAAVKKEFPESKWGPSHHAWYKSAIRSGRLKAAKAAGKAAA